MISYFLFLILLLVPPDDAQIIVGGNYSQADVAKAKAILAASEPKELRLKLGEFEVVEPVKDASPLQYQFLSSNSHYLWQIKPGQTFGIAGIRRGDSERRQHVFEAKPYHWAIVEAKKQGSEIIVINRNGKDQAKDPPEEIDRINVVVGDPAPAPPGPNPPGPTPPGPTPPLPQQGLRLMIVFESKNHQMSASQVAAINAKEFREYLNAKCVKVNNWPEWRVWDKDTDLSRESEVWKTAMGRWKAAGEKLPWLLISNGKEGYEGELPKDLPSLMALVKQYGGN